jgi:hypothetical protein
MNYEFITNVYRELDPGTEYVLDTLAQTEAEHIDIVFNIMLYRLTGSQITTHAALGFQKADEFSAGHFTDILESIGGASHVFGDAYRVAGMGEGSKTKNIGGLFAEIASHMPETYRRLMGAHNARDMYQIFNAIRGFGDFLSNQCMVDLLSVDEIEEERHWTFGTDEWCMPGPGAKRGIAAMLVKGIKPANNQMVMAWLRNHQQAEFERRDLQFPYLLNRDDTPKLLSICNIQTCLCEFQKYVRSRGHVKVRAYTSVPSKLQVWDTVLDEEQVEALRDITAVTPPDNEQVPGQAPETHPERPETEFMYDGEVAEAWRAPISAPSSSEAVPVAPSSTFPIPLPSAPVDPIAALQAALSGLHLGQTQQKPVVIPVDPQGLTGMPKCIVILPIY